MSLSVNSDTPIDGLAVIRRSIFTDHRGYFLATYVEGDLDHLLPDGVQFLEDDISFSRRNVLRGLHGDERTWKLVSCLVGEVFLAVADLRSSSPTFKATFHLQLKAEDGLQVLVPPGCVNGYQCLSEFAIFAYKQSCVYTPGQQLTVRWDDPSMAIPWPVEDPILSDRDRTAPFINFLSQPNPCHP